MYTIQREIGHLDNVRIGLVGDLANGRTARSLAYLLSMYKGVKIYFVAPEVVRMGEDIKDFLDSRGVSWEEADDLSQVSEGYSAFGLSIRSLKNFKCCLSAGHEVHGNCALPGTPDAESCLHLSAG